jgi:peroxiredoxin (alkyl hydroperoxide reductase subunit C)
MEQTENLNINKLPIIGRKIMDFDLEVYQNEQIKRVKLSDFQGKWLVLFFYPADFTFVCPTELEDMAEHYEKFKEINTEVLSVSTDTVFVHKAWHDHSPAIKKIAYGMAADPTGKLCRELGVYIEEEGVSLRGTFIFDTEGILKAFEVNDNSIGRNATELIRKLEAAQYVSKHGGEVCPANWKPGEKTLKPGLDLVGKI